MTSRNEVVPAALAGQGGLVVDWLRGLPDEEWPRPTRCPPWVLAELVAHLVIGLRRLGTMPAVPGPPTAGAGDYYRWVARRDGAANRDRVGAARDVARELGTPEALTAALAAALAGTLGRRESRPVRTRWGATMSTVDFVATRVVELVVHGMDLTDARGDPPLFHPPAVEVAGAVLADAIGTDPRIPLGWTDERFLRVATGRDELLPTEADRLGPWSARVPVLR
jgi:uncharacterized protein (TIGR03083 family)